MMDKVLEISIGDTVEALSKSGLYRVIRVDKKTGCRLEGKIVSSGPATIRFSDKDITRIINKKKPPQG